MKWTSCSEQGESNDLANEDKESMPKKQQGKFLKSMVEKNKANWHAASSGS
jgi:hypothetical protein